MTEPRRSASGFDLTPPSPDERKHLESTLTREEAEVLLHHGTEAPFCGGLLDQSQADPAALRKQGHAPRRGGMGHERRVQRSARTHQTDAVRPDQAHSGGAADGDELFLEECACVPGLREPRRQHQ